MKAFIKVIIVLLFIFTLFIFIFNNNLLNELEEINETDMPQIESKQVAKNVDFILDDGIYLLMNEHVDKVKSILGEPSRKDMTPYGYTWWIYNNDDEYIQLGIQQNYVETIFATGETVNSNPFSIGESFTRIANQFPVKEKVTYQKGISHYSFLLNEEDIKMQPLFKLSDDVFLLCYIDTITNKISSIRLISGDLLLKQRFYEMEYRGTLPPMVDLTDEQWLKVESGMEKQIYDLTNIYRKMMNVPSLHYDAKVSEVALLHSKDMYEQNYFSHDSKDGRGLKERMAEQNVYYLSAGENIAAQHLDAPAVIHGWLNSVGHRQTLLSDQYNYIGIGVHRLYYTQNFLLKP